METDTEIVQTEQAVRKNGRGGRYNFPSAVPPENPEDARRVLSEVMQWYILGTTKPQTDEELEERTLAFFADCINRGERPTVEKYVLATGYSKTTINDWGKGIKCSQARAEIIKKAFMVFSAYDAGMVTEGKMNPVPYIFRAKNYYGMKDQTDIVVEPHRPIADESAEVIAAKYEELPDD